MAAPSVVDTSTSSETANTTTHTVDLSTLTLTTGNLLLVFFAHDQDLSGTWTWPGVSEGDYDEVFDHSAEFVGLQIRQRKIDGTEGTSFDVTSSSAEQSAHCVYEITAGEDPATQAPEASAAASGTDTAPNPATVTPTGGSKDYLMIAACANDFGAAVSSYPTNCPDSQITINSGGTNGVSCAIASDQVTAASFNPTTFTIDQTDGWVAATIAVHPVGAAPAAGDTAHSMMHTLISRPGQPRFSVVESGFIGSRDE